jgi:NAD+ kinase
MKKTIRSVLIMANTQKADAGRMISDIQERLEGRGLAVSVCRFTGESFKEDIPAADLAISLGGDGTVLFCARLLAGRGIPILPVNLGSFGFITEVAASEWYQVFCDYEQGRVADYQRLMLQARVIRDEKVLCEHIGLNDVAVAGAGISNLVSVAVAVTGGRLGHYRADGVLGGYSYRLDGLFGCRWWTNIVSGNAGYHFESN